MAYLGIYAAAAGDHYSVTPSIPLTLSLKDGRFHFQEGPREPEKLQSITQSGLPAKSHSWQKENVRKTQMC